MKILLATDGSVHASTAMLTATKLIGGTDVKVDVVCVGPDVAPAIAGSGSELQARHKEQVKHQVQKTLKEAQSILAQLHLPTRGLAESGSPADKLLKLSQDYDLTVVGAFGAHERRQPGLGPVASRLLQQGTSNLLIGRELVNERNYRVLAALDSSEASLRALEALPVLFDPRAIEVVLMYVVEMSWASAGESSGQDDALDSSELTEYQRQLSHELRQTANSVVDSALRRLERWSIPASPTIKEGDPALELCSEAEKGGYDLVLAGATGASDIKHALLGSVSLKLAWDAPTSVAIIRRVPGDTG